jgi:hypothetical protein
MAATIVGEAQQGSRPHAFHAAFPFDDLEGHGFLEQEWIVAGDARGRPEHSRDVATRPFRTRVLVRRHADPARANGTVVVEWLNVSGGNDIAVTWSSLRDLLFRDGGTWVGVSAQPLGVHHLTQWDPQRYGALRHPGMPDGDPPPFLRDESYSESVFTEVGALMRSDEGRALFGGVAPRRLFAWGQSQSASRLTRYVGEAHRDARVYDGFVIHGGGHALLGDPPDRAAMQSWVDGIDSPVVKVDSETEALRAFPVQVDDTEHFRWWQVAGTGHGPGISIGDLQALYERDLGILGLFGEPRYPYTPMTIEYALRAIAHHLDTWTDGGAAPPSAPPLEPAPDGTPEEAARDEFGNACGGVRLPHIEVPRGRYRARNEPGDLYAMFAGIEPFDATTLARLYPDAGDYVAAVEAATARAVAGGFVHEDDVDEIVARARDDADRA